MDFWDAKRSITSRAESDDVKLLKDVGLFFMSPHYVAGYDNGYDWVDPYCVSQSIAPENVRRLKREAVVSVQHEILLILLLFPPMDLSASASPEASGSESEGASVSVSDHDREETVYQKTMKPWQLRIQKAMEDFGLFDCAY